MEFWWLHGGFAICTTGGPSPSVQKAMLTPSAVLAYWMRGSMRRLLYTSASLPGSSPLNWRVRLAEGILEPKQVTMERTLFEQRDGKAGLSCLHCKR
jgi:hypothetical protein